MMVFVNTKWDYISVSDHAILGTEENYDKWLSDALNKYGAEGWEAISVASTREYRALGTQEAEYHAVFKRPLAEPAQTIVPPTEIPPAC